jgi:catechol 2,3-dioxygenase-like lactoylglutathione lyase family enzyme
MPPIGDMHHVGITVRDLEESLQWYERMFEVQREFIAEGSGPELSRALGVPNANLRFAFLRFGSCVLELLCYDNDRETEYRRSNADVGSTHVCIDVPDLDAAYHDLKGKGGEFFTPPQYIDDGPLAGCSWAYFKDPNGVTLELFQSARGDSRGSDIA